MSTKNNDRGPQTLMSIMASQEFFKRYDNEGEG